MNQAVPVNKVLRFEPIEDKSEGQYSVSLWQDQSGMVIIDAAVPAAIAYEIVGLIHRLCARGETISKNRPAKP